MICWLLSLLMKPHHIWNLCLNLLTTCSNLLYHGGTLSTKENTSLFSMLIKILLVFILKWNSINQIYYYEIWKIHWFVWSVIVIYIFTRNVLLFFSLQTLALHFYKHGCANLRNFKSKVFFFLLCAWVILIVFLLYINLHNVIDNLKWKV